MKSTGWIPMMGAMVMLGGGFASTVEAQVGPAVANQTAAQVITKIIPLRNVAPGLIAYWLDPANNPQPPQLAKMAGPQINPYTAPKTTAKTGPLPAGVKEVVAIDPRNSLLVSGTAEGIAELEKMVAFLDKPLRQVEIEALFIQISDEDAKAFGIEPIEKLAQPADRVAMSFVRANVATTLNRLVAEKKAKILAAPRVTAINNLSASLQMQGKPSVLGFLDENGQFQPLLDPAASDVKSRLMIGTSWQFSVTPTINNDNTVTLLMEPRQALQLSSESNQIASQVRDVGGLTSIANVRDGDTIALQGLSARFFAGLNAPPTKSNVLILVTTRILRRVGDE